MSTYYQKKEAAGEPEPVAEAKSVIPEKEPQVELPPLYPVAPPPPRSPASSAKPQPPAPAPARPAPQPIPTDQPYRQVARAIYDELLKAGLGAEIPTQRLKDFLKSYVLAELKNYSLPLKTLYGFLAQELGTQKNMVDRIIENIHALEPKLMVRLLMPGSEMPAPKPPEIPKMVVEVPEKQAGRRSCGTGRGGH